MKHPRQAIEWDGHGVVRFRSNPLVRWLLDQVPMALNKTAVLASHEGEEVTDEDHAQLAQLMGYSVSGWGGLSYVSEEEAEACDAIAEGM